MRLERLRIRQLQQFRDTLAVEGLTPGINLFVGPNESGKSTLVRAIRVAFFERHKSTSLGDLQPWGDSSAAPEVELDFVCQGRHWRLHKRFLNRKRCDLQVDGEHFHGEEAEERLAELLGYHFPGRGASKAEHWGIPGLLWVEQGSVQEIRGPVDHAGEHLQAALGRSLGELASSGGDEVLERVARDRAALLTSTGRPTGEYAAAIRDCEEHQRRLAALVAQIDRYRQQVDRLAVLIRERSETDDFRPWEAYRTRQEHARARLDELRALETEQRREGEALEVCQRNQASQRQRLQDFEDRARQLADREAERQGASERLRQCELRQPRLDRRLEEARADYERANALRVAAGQQARRAQWQREYDQVAEQAMDIAADLQVARALQAALQEQELRHQAEVIDNRDLDALRSYERQLGELQIREQVLATRLHFKLSPGRHLTLDGEPLTGEGERLLVAAAELQLPGLGTLQLEPGGGADVAELARGRRRLEADRAELLQRVGVPDLDAAQARADQAALRSTQLVENRTRLRTLAPQGVDALAERLRLLEQRREQLAGQLAQVPEAVVPVPDESRAEEEYRAAEARLRKVEEDKATHRRDLELARQAQNAATDEWRRLDAELQSPQHRQRQQDARDQLTDLRAEEERLRMAIAQRQRHLDEASPDLLAQDIERWGSSAAALEQAAQQRKTEIAQLQGALNTLGAEGLEEAHDSLAGELADLERRRDQLARRAKALDLLLGLLQERRQALTRQLQAPLQRHLRHYLELLFPGADLRVDERLMPEVLVRGHTGDEQRALLDALSFGTREQLGLISRLAYADLLREAGRPTLILLDDALVHCDRQRLEQIKRLLYDAGLRHQILLFTCHPENWRDLGALPRDLLGLHNASEPAPA